MSTTFWRHSGVIKENTIIQRTACSPCQGQSYPASNRNLPGAATRLMALLLLSEQSEDTSQHVRESSEPRATFVNVSNGGLFF